MSYYPSLRIPPPPESLKSDSVSWRRHGFLIIIKPAISFIILGWLYDKKSEW
jgi:hypothetical protein